MYTMKRNTVIIAYTTYIFLSAILYIFISHINRIMYFDFLDSKYYWILNQENMINLIYFFTIIIGLCCTIFQYSWRGKIKIISVETVFCMIISVAIISFFVYQNNKRDGAILVGEYVLYAFFSQSFGVAIIEELFFRGFLLEKMQEANKRRNSSPKIIVINSVMFSIVHLLNLVVKNSSLKIIVYQLVLLIFFGIMLGNVYYFWNNLVLCIIIHTAYNMIPLLILDVDAILYQILYQVLLFLYLLQLHLTKEKI